MNKDSRKFYPHRASLGNACSYRLLPLVFIKLYRILAKVGNDVVEGVGSPDRAPERYYATMVHTRQSHVVFDVYFLGKTIRSIKEER